MTIAELIDALNTIPAERYDEQIRVHVRGSIGGFLDIELLDIDSDEDYIAVKTVESYQRSK